jgi:hypothetical protein
VDSLCATVHCNIMAATVRRASLLTYSLLSWIEVQGSYARAPLYAFLVILAQRRFR